MAALARKGGTGATAAAGWVSSCFGQASLCIFCAYHHAACFHCTLACAADVWWRAARGGPGGAHQEEEDAAAQVRRGRGGWGQLPPACIGMCLAKIVVPTAAEHTAIGTVNLSSPLLTSPQPAPLPPPATGRPLRCQRAPSLRWSARSRPRSSRWRCLPSERRAMGRGLGSFIEAVAEGARPAGEFGAALRPHHMYSAHGSASCPPLLLTAACLCTLTRAGARGGTRTSRPTTLTPWACPLPVARCTRCSR